MSKNYVGDYGVVIKLDIGTNISAASVKSISVKKPSGAVATWIPDIYGTNYLEYTTVSGDLDESGIWTVQPSISVGSFVGKGETSTFTIYDSFE